MLTFNIYDFDGNYLGATRADSYGNAELWAMNRWPDRYPFKIRMCA